MRALPFLVCLLLPACGSDPGSLEPATDALPARTDAPGDDARVLDDRAGPEPGRLDGARLDAGTKIDLKKGDGAGQGDAPRPDAPKPDLAKPDTKKPDAGKPDLPNPTGLTVPCQHGPGYTLFRFHYGGASHSPAVDVWSATCSYSYAPSSACNIYAVYPGFGSVSYTSDGYPILTTSEYLRVRFSVAGLSFSKATVHIQARSYATSSSTKYRVWSPIYGGLVSGPVDNDWVYDWYSLDWSNHLQPNDPPSLTAIQIYADQGSGHLAVKAVELCVQ